MVTGTTWASRPYKHVYSPHRFRVRAYEVAVEPFADADSEAPSVPTYPVTVEDGWVVVYV
jgi:nitrite reductase/ring-hydroxylating ferredoxin subunit